MVDMTYERMTNEFHRVLREQLDVDQKDITPTSTLVEDLGADSLGLVEVLLAVEEVFDMDVDDEEVEGIRTVQDCINLLSKKLSLTPKEPG